jgi:hypothetical protein
MCFRLWFSFFIIILSMAYWNTHRFTKTMPMVAAKSISYPLEDQKYVILVIQDDSKSQTRKTAKQKAAAVTLDNGYRYFSILSEEEVDITTLSQTAQSQVPENIYQELIIQKNFSRQNLEQNEATNVESVPAIRLIISCSKKKPSTGKFFDALKPKKRVKT